MAAAMSVARVLVVTCLLWCCESAKIDSDINSCENFQPFNFDISIGEIIQYYISLQSTNFSIIICMPFHCGR